MAKLTSHNSKPSIPKSTRVLRSHGKPPAARVEKSTKVSKRVYRLGNGLISLKKTPKDLKPI
jgi:hypothetical protein